MGPVSPITRLIWIGPIACCSWKRYPMGTCEHMRDAVSDAVNLCLKGSGIWKPSVDRRERIGTSTVFGRLSRACGFPWPGCEIRFELSASRG